MEAMGGINEKMRKNFLRFLTVMLLGVWLAFAGCSSSSEKKSPESVPTTIVLSATSLEIKRYESAILRCEILDQYGEKTDLTATLSSSDTNVVKIEENTLVAYSLGKTTVIARYEALQATCSVEVVENTILPRLMLGKTEVETYVGGSLSVSAQMTYNGSATEGAAFSYRIADPAVATVDEKGTVCGVALGETTLTVTATYRNETLAQTIPVYIRSVVSLSFANQSEKIYTSNINGDKASFKSSPLVYKDGTKIENAEIEYFECDEKGDPIADSGIVSVGANGEVTAVSRGETYVGFSWTNGEKIYFAKPLRVTVEIPVVQNSVKIAVDLDGGDEIPFSSVTELLHLNATDVTGAAIIGNEKEIPLTLTSSAIKGVEYGVQTIRIFNGEGYAQDLQATLYTKTISTAADLDRMGEILEANKYLSPAATNETAYYLTDGWFVLTDDIDYGGNVYKPKYTTATTATSIENANGFIGTFDGNNFSVSDIVIPSSSGKQGLFSVIASSGIVKNVNFDNVKFSATSSSQIALFAQTVYGTIQNVSVRCVDSTVHNSGVLTVNLNNSAKLNNVVLRLADITLSGGASGFAFSRCDATVTARNVYIINENAYIIGGTSALTYTFAKDKWANNRFITALKDENGVVTGAYFASLTDFKNGLQ